MILDAILAVFGSFLAAVFGAIAALFVTTSNLLLAAIEGVIGIFLSGFRVPRFKRRTHAEVQSKRPSYVTGAFAILVVVTLGAFGISELVQREIQFVAIDGHSIPFAEIVIETDAGVTNERTDVVGRLDVPRWRLRAITVKDPRYVEKTWSAEHIESRLQVERTNIGTALDKIADILFEKRKAAEPDATDNPDDAQRLREDH